MVWSFLERKKIKKVIVQVDNKVVVDSLDMSDLVLRQGLSLARRILLLTKKFEDVHFKHIYKDSNKCVDFLNKLNLPSLDNHT